MEKGQQCVVSQSLAPNHTHPHSQGHGSHTDNTQRTHAPHLNRGRGHNMEVSTLTLALAIKPLTPIVITLQGSIGTESCATLNKSLPFSES